MSLPHPEDSLIEESDTRAMIRLLGGVAAGSGSNAEKRKALMDGIVDLVDADRWCWGMLGRVETGELPTFSVLQKDGFTDQQFADYLRAQEHPDMAKLNAPFLGELFEKDSHLTRHRQQMDPANLLAESGALPLWQKANIGPIILSIRPIDGGKTSGIALFRNFGSDDFSARESRMAHILLSEVPWLHQDVPPDQQPHQLSALSPRLNTVLNLLTQGQPRKAIADQLDLSVHTVNEYAKDIYARFGVHSQTELLRRFVDGDGGDNP